MVVEGSPAPLFEAGSKFRGFRIVKVEEIPDVRATAYLIEHEATGARIIHLHTDDPENLFPWGFGRLPEIRRASPIFSSIRCWPGLNGIL